MLQDSFQKILGQLLAALKRFPAAVAVVIAYFLLSFFGRIPYQEGFRIFAASFCTACLVVAIQLLAESRDWPALPAKIGAALLAAALGWYIFQTASPGPLFMFLGTGLFLAIFALPFLRPEATSDQLWWFNYQLWLQIIIATIAATILTLGLLAIDRTLMVLFNFTLYGGFGRDIWTIAWKLVFPLTVLAGVPAVFHEVRDKVPDAIRLIVSYVVIPLLAVYTVILYLYIAKIVVTWSLPQGGVAYWVTGYAVIGLIAYLVSYPLRRDLGVVSLFDRYFFWLVLPPLLLLAAAIAVRISDYGITERRYAILLCLAWLTISTAVVLLGRREGAPKLIFASIVALLLIASFGPWGAVGLSGWAQLRRLEALLEKHHILVDGRIEPAAEQPDWADRYAISSIVTYLERTGRLSRIRPWFADMPKSALNDPKRTYFLSISVLKDMGVRYAATAEPPTAPNPSVFRYTTSFIEGSVEDVAGYDYLVMVDFRSAMTLSPRVAVKASNEKTFKLKTDEGEQELKARYEPGTSRYIVEWPAKHASLSFDLAALVAKLKEEGAKSVSSDPIVLEKSSPELSAKIIFRHIAGTLREDGIPPDVNTMATHLLLKLN